MIIIKVDDPLIPKNAARLIKLASANDWIIDVTHAGFLDKHDETHDSIAVRFKRFGIHGWAIWIDDGFDSAAISRPLASMGYRALIAYIQQPQQTGQQE